MSCAAILKCDPTTGDYVLTFVDGAGGPIAGFEAETGNPYTGDLAALVFPPKASTYVLDDVTNILTFTGPDGTTYPVCLNKTVTYNAGDILGYDVILPDGSTLPAGTPVPPGVTLINDENLNGTLVSSSAIDSSCKKFVTLELEPCPVSFPICGTANGSATQITDAAALQTYLDAQYGPGILTFDETNCEISGCLPVGVDFDLTINPAIGSVFFDTNAGTLNLDRIDTTDGSSVDVIWPDGSTATVPSGGSAQASGQPAGQVELQISGCACVNRFEVSGPWAFDIAELDQLNCLTQFVAGAGNATTGDICTLPAGLIVYRNEGSNTTTGDICTLPAGLTFYNNKGSNTTTGDIGTLPAGLTTYINHGSNTTTGDIGTLPAGLTVYNNHGSNTTTGDIGTLPAGLIVYNNEGSNTTTGDIGTLPAGLIFYNNNGNNTTTGDIGTLPAGLTTYINLGSNTTTGDIGTLPAGLTTYTNHGSNTTTGDIGTLPAGLTVYNNKGSNTTTGDIGTLPAGLTYYSNEGSNTTTGDIGTLPAGLTYYNNLGNNTTTYSTSYAFGSLSRWFLSCPVGGHTSAEVDQILIDAAAAGVTATSEMQFDVSCTNAPPTAASTAAQATLTGLGWTVITN